MKDLGQCCDGHLLFKACIEKAAKLILVGNKLASVKFYLYNDLPLKHQEKNASENVVC